MGCSANPRNHFRTLIMTIVIFISTVALLPPKGVVSLDMHDPIQIIGNSNFTFENGVVSGNGTWDDPFVIGGWDITSPGGRAMYIENTTAHFRIENVFIHDTVVDAGIYMVESSNGTVVDSLLENNAVAVCFAFSSNISISATNITDFEVGVRIWNSSNIRVGGLTFESGRRLLDIRGSSSVTVQDNTGDQGGLYIDGTSVEHFNSHEISTNNTVRGKPIRYFKDCTNLALDGSVAAQVIVANCSEIALANLSISGTEVAVELAFVQNGVVSSSIFSQTYYGIYETLSRNITYQDVVISSASNKAAWVRYSNDTTFSECNILSSTDGIAFSFSHNSTIHRSSFSFDLWAGYGIASMYSSDIMVEDNRFHTMLAGFIHSRGDNLTIIRNEFSNVRHAIEMGMVNDSLVAGNTAVDGHRLLLLDGGANRASVVNNTAIDMKIRALEFWDMMNSSVERNRIDNASDRGLAVEWSTNNTFSGNSIMNSYIGISTFQSRDNTFFHNNIINNTIQAYDWSASDNEWDNGYPSGGNYWSNYTGPDDFSGPNQDIPGSDGIRDLPFGFDPDTSDDYPLMSPVVTLPPDAPRHLTAELSGNGLENVTLSWNLSVDDVNGLRSVVGYDILRGTNYSSNLSGYILYDPVSKGSSQYTDVGGGEGDPYNYFYVVCAIDLNDNSSCSRNQAAKFTRPLSRGPNLVSIPLVLTNESIERILQTVGYDKAWYYDSHSLEWKSYAKFKSYSTLNHVNNTMGVWINGTRNSNLTVTGIVPARSTIGLHEGWNLVSFPSFSYFHTVAELKAETGATRVEGYDSAPPCHLRVLGDAEVLQAGQAYWVKVEASVSWIVDPE
ncbi:MAG: NosD domain-containing protein [Thermoplasmata archaeon]